MLTQHEEVNLFCGGLWYSALIPIFFLRQFSFRFFTSAFFFWKTRALRVARPTSNATPGGNRNGSGSEQQQTPGCWLLAVGSFNVFSLICKFEVFSFRFSLVLHSSTHTYIGTAAQGNCVSYLSSLSSRSLGFSLSSQFLSFAACAFFRA